VDWQDGRTCISNARQIARQNAHQLPGILPGIAPPNARQILCFKKTTPDISTFLSPNNFLLPSK
jgi:hypothetical protein